MGGKVEANDHKRTHQLELALAYADNIIATLRVPFVVLDKNLRVRTANAAFYRDFHASKAETEGRFVYDLGNGQWNIPQLRTLLSQVLSNSHPVEDFEVEHDFPLSGEGTCCSMLEGSLQRPTTRIWFFWPSRTLRSADGRKPPWSTPKSGIVGCSRWPRTAS